MQADSIQDTTRVVLSECRRGGIVPNSRSEMWRDIYLLPGTDLHGGIFGNRLSVEGPDVSVSEAVYVRGEVHVSAAATAASGAKNVTFGSCITAGDSIRVDRAAFRTRFRSNLYTSSVNLRNAVVYGNIYARNAVIRDSVVFGGVYCRDSLTIENCVVATFRSKQARLKKNVFLLFPLAISEEKLEIEHPVRALSFANLRQPKGNDPLPVIELDEADVYRLFETADEHTQRQVTVLSGVQRLLSAAALVGDFRSNRALLELVSMADHAAEEVRAAGLESTTRQLEDSMFGVLEQPRVSEITGYTTVADLLRRADVMDSIRTFASDEIADVVRREAEQELSEQDEGDADLFGSNIDYLFAEE